ncbi:MAG: transcriptional repressor LexA [Syntrophaceae bacterium]|nr:transcriptional repressor LexA [Syntrophaceae bacterium]
MQEKRTVQSLQKLLASFFRDNRRMPSFAEMTGLFGVRSKSVVHFWIHKLSEAGVVEKDDRGYLRMTQGAFAIPKVGSVRAGFPSPEGESLGGVLSVDEYLISKPEASFLLEVGGDSMVGEGILPGDLVVVEKGRDPQNGDVVVAEVHGEWTLKYFRRQGKQIVLEAANPVYPPIRSKSELRLGGVVTGVIRKYHA